jgi:hypothetical protein
MAQPPNSDKVKIRLFNEDGHLVIQYSVTNPDRRSEQCRDKHVASLREFCRGNFTDPERSDRLKIECGFGFKAKPDGSSKVWSLTKQDAEHLSRCFIKLNVVVTEGEKPWELCLDEEYDWAEWRRAITLMSDAKACPSRGPRCVVL